MEAAIDIPNTPFAVHLVDVLILLTHAGDRLHVVLICAHLMHAHLMCAHHHQLGSIYQDCD